MWRFSSVQSDVDYTYIVWLHRICLWILNFLLGKCPRFHDFLMSHSALWRWQINFLSFFLDIFARIWGWRRRKLWNVWHIKYDLKSFDVAQTKVSSIYKQILMHENNWASRVSTTRKFIKFSSRDPQTWPKELKNYTKKKLLTINDLYSLPKLNYSYRRSTQCCEFTSWNILLKGKKIDSWMKN